MIPNVTRGSNVVGLMAYLAYDNPRPDRKRSQYNVHESPHLVAGDEVLMTWHGGRSLAGRGGQVVARKIGRNLDRPRRVHGVDVRQRIHKTSSPPLVVRAVWRRWNVGWTRTRVRRCGAVRCRCRRRTACSPMNNGQAIANQFVRRMGFVGEEQPWDAGTPDCRWAAIRHGVSENGNDHVHIAVQVVRDDGTVADVNADYGRAQEAARELERSHGFDSAADRFAGRAGRENR